MMHLIRRPSVIHLLINDCSSLWNVLCEIWHRAFRDIIFHYIYFVAFYKLLDLDLTCLRRPIFTESVSRVPHASAHQKQSLAQPWKFSHSLQDVKNKWEKYTFFFIVYKMRRDKLDLYRSQRKVLLAGFAPQLRSKKSKQSIYENKWV